MISKPQIFGQVEPSQNSLSNLDKIVSNLNLNDYLNINKVIKESLKLDELPRADKI